MPPPHPSARVRSPLALVLQPGLESSCVSELASCNSPFPFHQFGHILGSQSLHGFALSMTKNALQQALDGLVAAVQSNVQQFQGNLQRGLQQMQAHMARHLQSTSGPGPMLAVRNWGLLPVKPAGCTPSAPAWVPKETCLAGLAVCAGISSSATSSFNHHPPGQSLLQAPSTYHPAPLIPCTAVHHLAAGGRRPARATAAV